MKNWLFFLILMFSLPLAGQGQKKFRTKPQLQVLPKEYLFKVDPASAIVHEFRCTIEKRWEIKKRERTKERKALITGRFIYFTPGILYHNIAKANPAQRFFGVVLRGGLRHYILGKYEHTGLFFNLGASWRYRKVSYYDSNLEKTGVLTFSSPGFHGSLGYQIAVDPKKNIVFGIHGGVEFYYRFVMNDKRIDPTAPRQIFFHWYDFNLFNGEFRPFISFEVGFALLQKARHW